MTDQNGWSDEPTRKVRRFLESDLNPALRRGMQRRVEAILDERGDAFNETGEEPHYRQHVGAFLRGLVRTQEPRLVKPGVNWCDLADERIEALAADDLTPATPARRR